VDDIFADWVAANWTQDADALGENARYGYRDFTLPFAAEVTHDTYPVRAETTVGNYATDYIVLEGAPSGALQFDFSGATTTRLADAPIPPGEVVWWSNRADDANPRLTRTLDLTAFAPGAPLTLTVDMWYDIEANYDYGYVMASRDGEKWTTLPGQRTTAADPTGNNLGVGYTGTSGGWVTEAFDLSEYAGGPVQLQFSYVTDDAVTTAGWLVRSLALTDATGAAVPLDLQDAWASAGWLLTDNMLPQRWLLQVMEFDGDELIAVRRVPVDEMGKAAINIASLSNGRTAVIAISGLTRGTTLPAEYRYAVEPN
jgi:immune inhibitor A